MAKLLEDYAKKLLLSRGIDVPRSGVASSAIEARKIAQEAGCSVVLKALIPASGKGKAGAVRFADTPEAAEAVAMDLLGKEVKGYSVSRVLIEERIEGGKEGYASITYSPKTFTPVILVSPFGGVEVEDLLREHEDSLLVKEVDPLEGLQLEQARDLLRGSTMSPEEIGHLACFLVKLYGTFAELDCRILEVNPVVVDKSRAIAIGTIMEIDADAVFRHPELQGGVMMGSDRAWRAMTDLERKAAEIDSADYRGTARYTEMENGDIGFLCGGGGASLTLFDAIRSCGGKPANYTECGGNPQEEKVYGLTKVVLAKRGLAGLLVAFNITNNTQTDVVARGVVKALRELRVDFQRFPVVVRLAGVNDVVAKRILSEAGVENFGDEATLEEVAKVIVDRIRDARSPPD